jgi:hypothetical protein
MDMHHVIGEALQYATDFIQALQQNTVPKIFPNTEN